MTLWQELATDDEERFLLFAVLGFGFVAVCAHFGNRMNSRLRWIRPINRFMISSFFAMLVMLSLMLGLDLVTPENDFPGNPPPTVVDNIVTDFYLVSIWPMLAFKSFTNGAYLSSHFLNYSLFLLTGFFWGVIIEAVLYLIALWRGKERKALA